MKCFFKRPPETQKALGAALAAGLADSHQVWLDLSDVSGVIHVKIRKKLISILYNNQSFAGCSWSSTAVLQAFAVWCISCRTCCQPSEASCFCLCGYTEQWSQRSHIWWIQLYVCCLSKGTQVSIICLAHGFKNCPAISLIAWHIQNYRQAAPVLLGGTYWFSLVLVHGPS